MKEHVLSLPQDEAFQRRDWAVQRAGAWAFGAILAGAAAGVFGGGPLARVHEDHGAFELEYDRFLRRTARTAVLLELDPMEPREGVATVELTGAYFTESQPALIRPLPARETALPDGVRLEFPVGERGAASVRIQVRPSGSGWREGEIRVNGHPVRVSGFVYP